MFPSIWRSAWLLMKSGEIEDREHGPDIIVLDIRMGEWNGLDLLQDIRNTYYSMPVILCSAYSSFKHDMKSVAADYYVVKSGDLTELKTRINMALGDRGKRWTISLKNSLKVSRGLADQENGANSVDRSF